METSFLIRLDSLQRIWHLRHFWFAMARKDLVQRYKGSFLGIGWSLLRPLAMTCIFCTVFGGLFNYPIHIYAPYLLVGTTTWQFFTESLLKGSHSFAQCSTYLRQQPVPLAIFPLVTVLGSIFHFAVALLMAVGVIIFFQGSVHPWAIVYLIPSLLMLFVLAWCLAIVSGVMHSLFPDTNHLLEIALQLLFYLTPILYRPDSFENQPGFSALIRWNPLSAILAMIRMPLIEGMPPSMNDLQICLCLVTVVGSIAVLLMRKFERDLIFWI